MRSFFRRHAVLIAALSIFSIAFSTRSWRVEAIRRARRTVVGVAFDQFQPGTGRWRVGQHRADGTSRRDDDVAGIAGHSGEARSLIRSPAPKRFNG